MQPPRQGSVTDSQLAELRKRRAELEGRPEDVQRMPAVLFPNADGSMLSVQEYKQRQTSGNSSSSSGGGVTGADSSKGLANTADYDNDTGGGVPKTVLQKILSSGQENDAPLTTRAVRELQRAQKERVYTQSLIRIK